MVFCPPPPMVNAVRKNLIKWNERTWIIRSWSLHITKISSINISIVRWLIISEQHRSLFLSNSRELHTSSFINTFLIVYFNSILSYLFETRIWQKPTDVWIFEKWNYRRLKTEIFWNGIGTADYFKWFPTVFWDSGLSCSIQEQHYQRHGGRKSDHFHHMSAAGHKWWFN